MLTQEQINKCHCLLTAARFILTGYSIASSVVVSQIQPPRELVM